MMDWKKKVKVEQTEEDIRIRNNILFTQHDGNFYGKSKGNKQFTGEISTIDKFVEFWGKTW